MGYIGVIVESPAKCKKIEEYLGSKYKCMASFGHLRTIDKLECINLSNFNIKFTNIPGKSKQISLLKTFIKNADEILLATDDDREGEAIAWHICDLFKLPINTKRIIFNEITKSALQNAVSNPGNLNMNTVNAQKARQVLDILVGFKISPLLWDYITYNSKTKLSAGRCQSPALRLIYDNQLEIEDNPGNKIYETKGYFTKKNLEFLLNKEFKDKDKLVEFLEESVDFDHIYNYEDKILVIKKPPVPFITSSLQQKCSSECKIKPKICMMICQKLYEKGYITYMRTDAAKYSDEFIDKSKKFIIKNFGKEYINKNIDKLSNKNKINNNQAQEAHEAIRPTDINIKEISEEFDTKEKKVYKIIRDNTIASCIADAKFNKVVAEVSAPLKLKYKYSAEEIIFLGWKKVYNENIDNSTYIYLTNLKQNSILNYKNIYSKLILKNLKNHYTEASLVQKLEKTGIGRPSTFASLVDKIQERNYVKIANIEGKKIKCEDFELIDNVISEIIEMREYGNEKNKLVIQPIGKLVIEFLIKHYDHLFNYSYTKEMEEELDNIESQNKDWKDITKDCLKQIEDLSKNLKINKKTIKIDSYHTYMIGKYGPIIKYENNKDIKFLKVIENIDINKLENGEYKINEIIIKDKKNGRCLGMKENKEILLKEGKYGLYLEWNNQKISVNIEDKKFDTIKFEDIENLLIKTIIVELTKHASLRKGKFGNYIYYKNDRMNKPKFIPFTESIENLSVDDYKKWLLDNHKIKL